MLFYEAVEQPKKDMLSTAHRPSDINPMSPVTNDGDKLSQLQVLHKYQSWFYGRETHFMCIYWYVRMYKYTILLIYICKPVHPTHSSIHH